MTTIKEFLEERNRLERARRLLGEAANYARGKKQGSPDDEAFVLVLEMIKEKYDAVCTKLTELDKMKVADVRKPKPRGKRR